MSSPFLALTALPVLETRLGDGVRGLIASPGGNGVLNDGLIRAYEVVMKIAGDHDWQTTNYESP